MSDSEDPENYKSLLEIHDEIEQFKKNPDTASMFVSGWDDADQDVDLVKDHRANPIDHLLWAAENGEVDTLKEILSKSQSLVNARDADGYTALHRAAYSNHVEAISYLLSKNASVKVKTEMGWTPLHSACNWNNYSAAARLLAGGADPKAVSDGEQTPLHLASAISHCKSSLQVLLLREDIVDVARKVNKAGETPEELARRHGIYAPLFEMALPAACYIKSLGFTSNPYVRKQWNKK